MLKFNRVKKRHAFSTGETDDEEEAEKLAKVTKAFIIMSLIKMRHECTIYFAWHHVWNQINVSYVYCRIFRLIAATLF